MVIINFLVVLHPIFVLSCDMFQYITIPSTPLVTQSMEFNHNQEVGIGIWTRFIPAISRFESPLAEIENMLVFSLSDLTQSEFYVIYAIKLD